jgi:hypothetical protein
MDVAEESQVIAWSNLINYVGKISGAPGLDPPYERRAEARVVL